MSCPAQPRPLHADRLLGTDRLLCDGLSAASAGADTRNKTGVLNLDGVYARARRARVKDVARKRAG